jgi:hypothetical protein
VPITLPRSVASFGVETEPDERWFGAASIDGSVFVPGEPLEPEAQPELQETVSTIDSGPASVARRTKSPTSFDLRGVGAPTLGLIGSRSWAGTQRELSGLLSPSYSASALVRLFEGLGGLEPSLAAAVGLTFLGHLSPTVREHAIYAVERGIRQRPHLRAVVAWMMLSDPSPGVRAAARDVIECPQ